MPRLVSFLVGVLMLFTALISPVDPLGEQLFVMHVVQHILLTDFAAVSPWPWVLVHPHAG